jgi:uncharacterized membrane protein YccC
VTRLRVSDPDDAALRWAARAAVVAPSALAIGQLGVDNPNTALFAGFGALALFFFVDFGGPRVGRLAAYSALLVVGAVLILLGTLCSSSPLLATVVMAVVGFVVLFGGIINGYFAAATNAVLLSFILAVMVPADASDIPSRLGGWAIGGVLAATATLVLFPERQHDKLRAAAADACRALADVVADPHRPGREDVARAAVRTLRVRFVATPFRPTGSTGAGAALASIVDELGWLLGLALRDAKGHVEADTTRAATVAVLRESAQRLAGQNVAIKVDRLAASRQDLLDGLVRRLGNPAVRNDDGAARDVLHSTWQLRAISYATLRIAELTRTVGGSLPPRAAARTFATVRQLVADHANLRSVWMRNALRATAALSTAVLVGQLTSVQHAFWVVLGTLSVLRSSAVETGASVLRALVGTIIGIVIGGVLIAAIGSDELALWIAFPPAIFFAAYAPRAISFVAGQAGFTVAILVLFNLVEPTGWEVGLVRIEDVAIGFAISIVVGVLFWPRGATAILQRSFDDAYEACAAYLTMCGRWLLDRDPALELTRSRRRAIARERLLDAAVRQFRSERAPPAPRIEDVTMLVAGSVRLRVTGDALTSLGDQSDDTAPAQAAGPLRQDLESVRSWYATLGRTLASGTPPPRRSAAEDEIPREVVDGVRAAAATGDDERTIAAVVASWFAENLNVLRRLEDPISETAVRIAQH